MKLVRLVNLDAAFARPQSREARFFAGGTLQFSLSYSAGKTPPPLASHCLARYLLVKPPNPETTTMTFLRLIYAALIVVGTLLPWSYFYAWFDANGWSLSAMIDAWYVNDATSGLVYDLTIAAVALTVWALWEGLVRRDRWFLAVIPATYAIGVSAGLPLALLLMTRRSAA